MLHVTCYIKRVLALCTLALLTTVSLLIFAAPPAPVYAQDFTPLAPIETGSANPADNFLKCTSQEVEGVWNKDTQTWTTKPSCLPKYLRTVYNTGVALAGLFLVFSIVRGGFELMFTDSILGKLEGKKIILQALGGAVIVYSSWLLMTALNPQLGRDLNLALDFPRVKVKAIPVELVPVYDDVQLQKLYASIDSRRGEIATERTEIANNITTIKAQLAEAEEFNDSEEIARLKKDIGTLERRDAELALTDHAKLLEKKTTFEGERAQSWGAANSLYSNYFRESGNNRLTQMRSAFDEYRAGIKDDLPGVIASHGAQMGRIGSSAEAVATGLIENPNTALQGIAFITEQGRELEAAQTKIGTVVNTIDSERRQRVNALAALRATADAQTRTLIQHQINRVNNLARANLTHIKDKCVQAGYGCKDNPILKGY